MLQFFKFCQVLEGDRDRDDDISSGWIPSKSSLAVSDASLNVDVTLEPTATENMRFKTNSHDVSASEDSVSEVVDEKHLDTLMAAVEVSS